MVSGGVLVALLVGREMGRALGWLSAEQQRWMSLAAIPVALSFALVVAYRLIVVVGSGG